MIIDEIETLHDIARCVSVAIPAAEYGNEMLHEVIERIACQLDSEKSIWQKIADERYPACEWVEAHGGIDAVKRRLMPEGMEWPRYEDGEPVRIGDVVSDVEVRSVVFRDGGILLSDCTSVPGWGTWRSYKEPIKRPAPKVLDTDGVEIRVGDTVYLLPGDWCDEFPCLGYHGGEKLEVFSLHADHVEGGVGCRDTRRPKGTCYPQPSQITHRALVLAADGKPLEAGQTVWTLDNPSFECVVLRFVNGTVHLKSGADHLLQRNPSLLTHERPDSWERIEADCMQDAKDYCEEHGIEPEYPKHIGKAKCEDLVRRAKKLAGVE